MIVSSGYRVDPREIERTLEDEPSVHEAIVGGVSDDELGERIVAHVVPTNQANRIDDEILVKRVRNQLGTV